MQNLAARLWCFTIASSRTSIVVVIYTHILWIEIHLCAIWIWCINMRQTRMRLLNRTCMRTLIHFVCAARWGGFSFTSPHSIKEQTHTHSPQGIWTYVEPVARCRGKLAAIVAHTNATNIYRCARRAPATQVTINYDYFGDVAQDDMSDKPARFAHLAFRKRTLERKQQRASSSSSDRHHPLSDNTPRIRKAACRVCTLLSHRARMLCCCASKYKLSAHTWTSCR